MCTKGVIAPNDFSVQFGLRSSPLQDCAQEEAARNIIVISQLNENKWLDFTWKDYDKMCKHEVSSEEKEVLDELVELGYLSQKNGIYSIEDYFISLLIKFVRFN